MAKLLDTCAHELMDTAPKIIQSIRSEMRSGHGANLSIPQFRSLRFIQRNPDTSLSDLANHLGLTLPSVSKLVDGLVKKGLISRQESTADRRRLTLGLTQSREAIINSARANAQVNIAKILSNLSNEELNTIHRTLELLNPLFTLQRQQNLKV
jgi:MarR family transcriptional regulator for hemolysin